VKVLAGQRSSCRVGLSEEDVMPKRLTLDDADIVRRYQAGELELHIAKALGVSAPVIHRRLAKADVSFRTHSEAATIAQGKRDAKTTESLPAEYLSGRSVSELAKATGFSRNWVRIRLERAGVPLRGVQEAHTLICHKTFPTTEESLELIDGLLLGDAWLEKTGGSEGRLGLAQRADRKEWLEQVQRELRAGGVKSNIKPRPARIGHIGKQVLRGNPSLQLRTLKYKTFTDQRLRWYPKGKKIIPLDIRLTPRALAHWYWGDGGLINTGYGVAFCTDGFTWEDVEFLASRLRLLYGWSPRVQSHRGNPRLVLSQRKHRLELVALTEPFCPDCFRYKLQVRGKAPAKIDQVEKELRQLRGQGWTQKRIAEHFQMTPAWAGWACRRLGLEKESN